MKQQSITITSNSVSTIIKNYTAYSSSNSLVVFIEGPLHIIINGISNPVRYLGSLQWNFTVSDLSDNPSSFSQVNQTPDYTVATASVAVQLTNSII